MLDATVLDYLELATKLGETAFCHQLQVPVLVVPVPDTGNSFQSCPTRVVPEEEQSSPNSRYTRLSHQAGLIELHPGQPNPEQRVTIGRSEDNDVVLQDGTVSSRHAAILFDAHTASFALQDQESTNGTAINGRSVVPLRVTPIQDGDVLSFGDAVFLFFTPSGFYQALREKLGLGQQG